MVNEKFLLKKKKLKSRILNFINLYFIVLGYYRISNKTM